MPRTKKITVKDDLKTAEANVSKDDLKTTEANVVSKDDLKTVEVKTTQPLKDEPPKKRGRKPKEVIKKVRVASSYATFIKNNYDSVRNLPTKERFKALSVLWKQEKKKA